MFHNFNKQFNLFNLILNANGEMRLEKFKKNNINYDFISVLVYIHCSKKLVEQTKQSKEPCETAMHEHKKESTRISMLNTEKKRCKKL